MQELKDQGFVRVRGARENNLKNIDVDIPRDALVVFTGVSGSGKSSLAFGTLYAEAQRRYLESVSPYARRLFNQMSEPDVDEIDGLPPAVALQQQRGTPSTRSSVGSVTSLSNLLRLLYSRAGTYPPKQTIIYAEGFSPNTPEGACPVCHGLGKIYDATEKSMVLDDSLSIREKAIAAWPTAWGGQNLRDILVTLGFDIDVPWKKLSKKDRDWILFTDETPSVPVYAGFNAKEVKVALRSKMEPSYYGNFVSAKNYVLNTFATTQSQLMKKRVAKFMVSAPCSECKGKRLKKEALSVTFEGLDITSLSQLPLKQLNLMFSSYADGSSPVLKKMSSKHPEQALAATTLASEIMARIQVLLDLGLGYLSLERSTPTLSPGELQRLRLANQVHSNLFGVIYVLDEPSAGLHPSDTEALLRAFQRLKSGGNSLFVVEHEIDVIHAADWIVDVGPLAGVNGGEVLYSGPPRGLLKVSESVTKNYLFGKHQFEQKTKRSASEWLQLRNLKRNNLDALDIDFPLGVFTSVTGISGSGKSTLVGQLLAGLVLKELGHESATDEDVPDLEDSVIEELQGEIKTGMSRIKRLVQIDQKPIGRTPRSNLATYTGLFDYVRKLFAETKLAKSRRYDAGRFSFNVSKGRCENCQGEGFVMVELLFLPSVYSPCPICQGTRFNAKTLEVKYKGKNISEVLKLTVDDALLFFDKEPQVMRSLSMLKEVGLGYIQLGQPATELSGGEAQRVKLATELQRISKGETLYILDEPTTGLHPSDVERLLSQLNKLVDAGNTVIMVEHDMKVIAESDWIIDMGPGAGDEGGKIVVTGTPEVVARHKKSLTSKYLQNFMGT
ncbi:excinuclease ABC subunit UvrA [Peredibacter starrii]|uniref:UvrABC system protein A n=1 Tax=Peredibacter starrii TaxID=28202 RepID=A0AAX4HM27_9BACT|nr:excinuclease ABC subunit UvrA [Peredibacter starrii]WPU64347.1 excinuclease ABC subunit UvrA [Peredibacter starrii]